MLRLFAASEALTGGLLCSFCRVLADRRETVSTPFPRQLESSGLTREFSAFVSCLEDIPGMREVRVDVSLPRSVCWSCSESKE